MTDENHYKKIRIFLASPADLTAERGRLLDVVAELNRTGNVADHLGLTLEVIDWQSQVAPFAGRPESVILQQLPARTWDIFIGVLWYRFGTPTGAVNPQTGEPFASGTEEEFSLAYNLWKQTQRPKILFYRCTRVPASLDDIEPDQYGRVRKFFANFDADKMHPGLYWDFQTPEEFEKRVRLDLTKLLYEYSKEVLNQVPPKPKNEQVFVVHGHDESIKQRVARFLERLGLDPIILHEKPDEGRTIIEKFEDYSEVARYAIVLLTPDDIGGVASEQSKLSPRARQNVVFEMGYFIGKLGRNRVCSLYRGVEVPSDLQGLLYIPFDDKEAWRLLLARELRAAGLAIDLNRAL